MVARYCTACRNPLAESCAFCSNCGRPVHETAQVNASHADVQVPPPPYQQQAPSYHPQSAGSSVGSTQAVRAKNYWITFAVLAVLVLMAGGNGTVVGFIGLIIATVWVYQDASSRGMKGAGGWAAGVFLLFIIFFPLYFFQRRPQV
jgi:nitrate reductase NapE component